MAAKSGHAGSYTVHYRFSQHFDFPAKVAYSWSMDYRSDDLSRMAEKGTRKIKRINDDTLMLTDTYFLENGGRLSKRRLIRMYPEILTMVNTRVSKDARHSQFIYQFVDEGEGKSRLDFTGAQVFYGERPAQSRLDAMARKLSKEDSAAWVHLASAMKEDLGPRSKRSKD